MGIADLIAIVQPEIIVIGGSVGVYFEKYEKLLKEALRQFETPLTPTPPIIKAGRPDPGSRLRLCYDLARRRSMEISNLVDKLRLTFPHLTFIAAMQPCWSPENRHIYYNAGRDKPKDAWGLFHELGHATLGHKSYSTDVDLLQKEVAAWGKAATIAETFNVSIDDTYIQDCLETYRDWLYKRSVCPACGAHGIQNERAEAILLP